VVRCDYCDSTRFGALSGRSFVTFLSVVSLV
jgi:hypothetical protein